MLTKNENRYLGIKQNLVLQNKNGIYPVDIWGPVIHKTIYSKIGIPQYRCRVTRETSANHVMVGCTKHFMTL